MTSSFTRMALVTSASLTALPLNRFRNCSQHQHTSLTALVLVDGQLHVLLPKLVEKSFVILVTLFFSQYVTRRCIDTKEMSCYSISALTSSNATLLLLFPFVHETRLIRRPSLVFPTDMVRTSASKQHTSVTSVFQYTPCRLVSFDGELSSFMSSPMSSIVMFVFLKRGRDWMFPLRM